MVSTASVRANRSVRSRAIIENGVRFHHHPNGGGLVAETANVEESVFIGPKVIVRGSPNIRENVRLDGYTRVWGSPDILDNVQVAGFSRVFGGLLEDSVLIGGQTMIGRGTHMSDHVIAFGRLYIMNGRFSGNMIIDRFTYPEYQELYQEMNRKK